MTTYVFSYHTQHQQAILKRRPWWNFWGRDSIEYVKVWTRKTHSGVSQTEADLLTKASDNYWNNSLGQLITRLLDEPYNVQLEVDQNQTSNYVSTGPVAGVKYARCVTNELYFSREALK